MFKNLTTAVALLVVSMTASAEDGVIELNNDSVIEKCHTVDCVLDDAGISYIGAITNGDTGETLVVILADDSQRAKACSLVSPEELLFMISEGSFEGC